VVAPMAGAVPVCGVCWLGSSRDRPWVCQHRADVRERPQKRTTAEESIGSIAREGVLKPWNQHVLLADRRATRESSRSGRLSKTV
jgi:hypothetical protein